MYAKLLTGFFISLCLATTAAFAGTPAPGDAQVYFITPKDGEVITGPVTIKFGLKGMGVTPAGIDNPNTGHHHLLINVDKPNLNKPIPSDAQHKHFGGGQTEATIDLPPGKHTLQLMLGDMGHVPHSPPVMSEKITITVR